MKVTFVTGRAGWSVAELHAAYRGGGRTAGAAGAAKLYATGDDIQRARVC